MSFHNTTDNPSKYQDPAELEAARARDPIRRVQAYLKGRGMWDEKREQEFEQAISEEIEAAIVKAQKAPLPNRSQIFDNVFAELTPRQAAQRRELLGEG